MGGVRGGAGHVGGAQGGGAQEALSCPFEIISGLHSSFPRQVCQDHFESGAFRRQYSTTGGLYVSGRQTQGDTEAVGSPVCLSTPLLVHHPARVDFVGIQAGWYRPWGCLGVLVLQCRRVCGPTGPWPSCPACVLGPGSCGDQEELKAARSRSDASGH